MSKDPAVLFYTSDFLSGTSFFTDEQKGQYITLLCQQHQLYSIPENHMIIICKSLDSPVVKKFIKEGNSYYNKRMRLEAEKRANYCSSRGNNKKGHFKEKIISKSYENHMENDNDNEDIKRTTNTTNTFDFNTIWETYPSKIGRKEAERHFNSSVKTEQDYLDVKTALMNYKNSKRVSTGYILNGSTFFNQWKDWATFKEDFCKKCKGQGKFISSTGYEIVCDCKK